MFRWSDTRKKAWVSVVRRGQACGSMRKYVLLSVAFSDLAEL